MGIGVPYKFEDMEKGELSGVINSDTQPPVTELKPVTPEPQPNTSAPQITKNELNPNIAEPQSQEPEAPISEPVPKQAEPNLDNA